MDNKGMNISDPDIPKFNAPTSTISNPNTPPDPFATQNAERLNPSEHGLTPKPPVSLPNSEKTIEETLPPQNLMPPATSELHMVKNEAIKPERGLIDQAKEIPNKSDDPHEWQKNANKVREDYLRNKYGYQVGDGDN